MGCKWDQRLVLGNRVAKIVPSATSGAVNLLSEVSILTLPSPRLQAVIGFPNTPQPAGSFWSWLDAANAVAHSDGTPASWSISPIVEAPVADLPAPTTFDPATGLGAYLKGASVFGATAAPMIDLVNGDDDWFSPAYTIGGEATRRWLISATLKFYGTPAQSWASLIAEIVPAPGVTMSAEEWTHWQGECSLVSLTSNSGNPPLLKSV